VAILVFSSCSSSSNPETNSKANNEVINIPNSAPQEAITTIEPNLAEVTSLAIKQEQITICQELETNAEKDQCRNDFNLSLAVRSNDQRFCQQIADLTQRDFCLLEIASSIEPSGDPKSICAEISNQEIKNDCLDQSEILKEEAAALEELTKNQEDLCAAIEDPELREACSSTQEN
jgi:hypothetical protein